MADITDATFATDVIERSHTVPVVVDLWAPWCGPCQSLGPILERVIGETQGLVELAKVNVDENPQVSQAFQVQSIPAVYAMRDGQVVDGFMGAQPESEIVSFVQRLLDSTGDSAAEGGDETETTDDSVDSVTEPEGGVPDAGVTDEIAEPEPVPAADVPAIQSELEALLPTVKADDDARTRYLELLDQLGSHPDTNTYRRRLASALY